MKKKMLAIAALVAACPLFRSGSASAQIAPDVYGGHYTGYYTEEGIVTSVLNLTTTANTFTVQDNTGSVLVYSIPKTTYTATVGDDITFSGYNAGYQDNPEFVAGNVSNGLFTASINSQGNPVSPFLLTIPQAMTAGTGLDPNGTTIEGVAPYSEAIVTLDNVHFNSSYASLSTSANTTYYINDGIGDGLTLYDYKSDSAVLSAVTAASAANPGGYGGTYDITGYLSVYYGTPELYPTAIVSVPEPTSLGLLGFLATGLLGRRRRKI